MMIRLKEFVVTIWRDSAAEISEAYDRVHDRVPYRLLEPIQKNIIQYCSVPRSAREILEHINYKYHPDAIAEMLKPLLSMGYLELTIPDKPNSLKQKYRKK